MATDRELLKLTCPPGKKRARFAVDSVYGKGLTLEVRETGSRVWLYRYRHDGKEKELKLGAFPAIGVKEATERHRQAIAEGGDVKTDRKAKAAAEAAELQATTLRQQTTWGDIFTQWRATRDFLDKGERSQFDIDQVWKAHYGAFAAMYPATTSWRDIEDYLRAVLRGEHSPTGRALCKEATRRGHGIISALVLVASRMGLCEPTLMAYIPIRNLITARVKQDAQRVIEGTGSSWDLQPRAERVLSADELGHVYRTLSGIDHPCAWATRFAILTGLRRAEVCNIESANIIGDTLRITDTKTTRLFEITLTDEMKRILAAVTAWHPVPPRFPFSTTAGGRFALDGPNLATWLRRRFFDVHCAGWPPFSMHDLRRTFATRCAEDLNADYLIIEACLNHALTTGVAARYNRAAHRAKMAELWQQYSDYCGDLAAR